MTTLERIRFTRQGQTQKTRATPLAWPSAAILLLLALSIASPSPGWGRQARQPARGQRQTGRGTLTFTRPTIPFTYDPLLNAQIIVHARINGGPLLAFAVDTGTSVPFVLTPWAAKELKLTESKSPNVTINGKPSGYTTAPLRRLQVLTSRGLADIKIFHIPAIVSDITSIVDKKGEAHIAGILGIPFLDCFEPAHAVQIDFASRCLRICRIPTHLLPDDRMIVLPLTVAPHPRAHNYWGALYNVLVALPGHGPAEFLLDTGAPDNVLLNLGSGTLPGAMKAKAFGNLGTDIDLQFSDSVLIPHLMLDGQTVPSVYLGVGNYSSTPSTLGLKFLSRFTVTLDFLHHRLILQRPAHAPPSQIYGASDAMLMSEGKQGGYRILSVNPVSPAASAGLRPDDQVIAVDCHPISHLDAFIAQRLLDGFAGTRAWVKVLRGRQTLHLTYLRRNLFDGSHDPTVGVNFAFIPSDPYITAEFPPGLYVDAITPGCPAQKAGLAANDRVTRLNGQPVASLSGGQVLDDLNQAQNTMTVQRQGLSSPLHFRFTDGTSGKPATAVQVPAPQTPAPQTGAAP